MSYLKLPVICISLTITTISTFSLVNTRVAANTVTTKQIQTANNWLTQGLLKIQQKNYQDALSDFDKAIQINNQSAKSYFYRGLIYAQYAQNTPSKPNETLPGCRKIDDFRTICELDLTSSWKQKNKRKAIEDFTNAIEINPQYAEAYYQRGLLQSEATKNNEDSQRAVDLYLQNTLQHLKQDIPKQQIQFLTNIPESIENPIGSSTESSRKSPSALMYRANYYFRKGDRKTALIIYKQVGRMFKANKEDKRYQEVQQIIQRIEQIANK